MHRRLQTACCAVGLTLPFFLMFLNFVFIFTPALWPLYIIYLVWFLCWDRGAEGSDNKRWPWLQNMALYKHFREYFPSTLVRTQELDPSKTYIFGAHPHGIIGISVWCNIVNAFSGFEELFPIKLRVATLNSNFYIPFFRDYALLHGFISCARSCLLRVLRKKTSVMIVVGGASEALDARPGVYKIILKRRKGFVKLALETGSSLVPVFCFGENDLYRQLDNPDGSMVRRLQNWGKRVLGFSMPLINGRGIINYDFGLLPHRTHLRTVVGAPIDVPLTPEPTPDQVDHYHKLYMDGLAALFEKHKENETDTIVFL